VTDYSTTDLLFVTFHGQVRYAQCTYGVGSKRQDGPSAGS